MDKEVISRESVMALLSGSENDAVDARKLHDMLGVETVFANWIKRMLRYGFEEGLDYTVLRNGHGEGSYGDKGIMDKKDDNSDGEVLAKNVQNPTDGVFAKNGKNLGGRPTDEYFITNDMAKELCMLQRSEIGRSIRRYFIEIEKLATDRQKASARLIVGRQQLIAQMYKELYEKANKTNDSLQMENHLLGEENQHLEDENQSLEQKNQSLEDRLEIMDRKLDKALESLAEASSMKGKKSWRYR